MLVPLVFLIPPLKKCELECKVSKKINLLIVQWNPYFIESKLQTNEFRVCYVSGIVLGPKAIMKTGMWFFCLSRVS